MTARYKVCMLGAFAVGKTSLVRRYVHSIFSDKYLTTVGVKVEKRDVTVGGDTASLVLWDIQGEDDLVSIRESYIRGAHGVLLVADGTRKETLDKALELHERTRKLVGPVPAVILLNKSDLTAEWELDDDHIASLESEGRAILRTSAQTGAGVGEAFDAIARGMHEA